MLVNTEEGLRREQSVVEGEGLTVEWRLFLWGLVAVGAGKRAEGREGWEGKKEKQTNRDRRG